MTTPRVVYRHLDFSEEYLKYLSSEMTDEEDDHEMDRDDVKHKKMSAEETQRMSNFPGGNADKSTPKTHPAKDTSTGEETGDTSLVKTAPSRQVEAHGLHSPNLVESLHKLQVSSEVLVMPQSSFDKTLVARASDANALVLPWSETGGMSEPAIIHTGSRLQDTQGLPDVGAESDSNANPVASDDLE